MVTVFDGDRLILIPENKDEVKSLKKLPDLLKIILPKVTK